MVNIQELLIKQLSQNPNYEQIVQMVGNRDPKEVFLEECKKRGINPESILKMLK